VQTRSTRRLAARRYVSRIPAEVIAGRPTCPQTSRINSRAIVSFNARVRVRVSPASGTCHLSPVPNASAARCPTVTCPLARPGPVRHGPVLRDIERQRCWRTERAKRSTSYERAVDANKARRAGSRKRSRRNANESRVRRTCPSHICSISLTGWLWAMMRMNE
jgi:hypothetical protein